MILFLISNKFTIYFNFEKVGALSTRGTFMHMFTLTVVTKVTVRSKTNKDLFA